MDEFISQTGGQEVKEGHEERDLSIRGIIMSAVGLAVCGFLAFILMKVFLVFLPGMVARIFPQPELTPVEKQLLEQREPQAPPAEAGRVEISPRREDEEVRLQRTFPTPRLQYDDVLELNTFRVSEDKWLSSAGKDADGNVHVPVEDAMQAIAEHGLPAVSGAFVAPSLPTAVPMVPATERK